MTPNARTYSPMPELPKMGFVSRRLAPNCPCGKSNRDGKFHPFDKPDAAGNYVFGTCFSCGEKFAPPLPGREWNAAPVRQFEPPLPKEPDQIPFGKVAASLDPKHRPANSLWQYLAGCFTAPVADALFEKYRVGTSKLFRLPSGHMAALLLQTDVCGRVRHAKAMVYDPATGKRNKAGHPCQRWNKDREAYFDATDRDAIEFLGKTILGDDAADLRQCLFGEHLLFTEQKPVAIVESERTAMFCAAAMPGLVWLATGSKGGMKQLAIAEKVACLAGRTVFLFPDNDGFEEWVKDAAAVQAACPTASVFVNDYLKKETAGRPECAKWDIEDFWRATGTAGQVGF